MSGLCLLSETGVTKDGRSDFRFSGWPPDGQHGRKPHQTEKDSENRWKG